MPSLRSGRVREAIPEVREWSEGYYGRPIVVGKPSLRSRSVQEAIPEVREWSEGPHKGP